MSAKETELAQAARGNQLQTMERLIAEGVSADAKNEHGTPVLVLAAEGGHLDALKLLRRHGANLDATDSGGETALMEVALSGKADCAGALLEWGADKDAADTSYGNTALHAAAGQPKAKAVHVVVAPGAEFVAAGLGERRTTEFAGEQDERVLEHAALLEVLDERGDGLIDADGFTVVVAAHVLVAVPVDARGAK